MTAGDIYTVAGNGTSGFSGDGGPATGAELNGPRRVTVDGAGNLLIADSGNNRVRVVAAAHRHLLRAGDDRRGHLHGGRHRHLTGSPATAARPPRPSWPARTRRRWTARGTWSSPTSGNNRVRVVAASTGTFYGQAMTAGDIYTVAGNGQVGYGVMAAWLPRPSSTAHRTWRSTARGTW